MSEFVLVRIPSMLRKIIQVNVNFMCLLLHVKPKWYKWFPFSMHIHSGCIYNLLRTTTKTLSVNCLILNSGQWSQHVKPSINMSVRVLLYSSQNSRSTLNKTVIYDSVKKMSGKRRSKPIQTLEILPFINLNYLLSALKQCFRMTKKADHWCATG